jgi:hypothetical protein
METMGILLVAFSTARLLVGVVVKITSTCRATSSAANPGTKRKGQCAAKADH